MVNLPGVGERAGHCLGTANEASRLAANEASGQTEKAGRRVERRRQTGGRAAEEEKTPGSSAVEPRDAMVLPLLFPAIP